MKTVTFGMYYEMYGHVTIEVPDDITEDNVEEYLRSHWDEYPLPNDANYVHCSDELDTENICIEEN